MTNLTDSSGDLLIVVTEEDVACAVPKDPSACAIAQAIKRTVHTPRVEVHRTVVRVDLPDEKGELTPTRFRLRGNVKGLIEKFDRTGEFPPGVLRLCATEGTAYSLKAKRDYMNTYNSIGPKQRSPQRKAKAPPNPEVRQFDRARHDD